MLTVLRVYREGEHQVTEYTKDGVNVSHTLREPVQTERVLTLNEIKKKKLTDLQDAYYASFVAFQSAALGETRTYPFDKEAQDNLRDLQSRLIADPNKDAFYFKTVEDGTLVLHTRSQFLALMEDAEMFKVEQTIKINDLANQVSAATTKEEVDAVAW